MQVFDRIEPQEISGLHELFAFDDQKNEGYLLRNPIVRSDSSEVTGHWIYVDTIRRRDSFESKESLDDFSNNLMTLIHEIDVKNARIKKWIP